MIDRAAVLCAGDTILPEHLSPSLLAAAAPAVLPAATVHPPVEPETLPSPDHGGQGLQDEIKSLERARITKALERSGGNQSKAAEALGISRRTLVSRLSEFGLPRPRKSS